MVEHAANKPKAQPQSSPRTETPGQRRGEPSRRGTILAIIAVVLLLGFMIWVVQMFVAQQKLERCLATGRRDCLQISVPPRDLPPGDER